MIEAKYGAGPSGMPDEGEVLAGQLGRQWAAARVAFGAQRPLVLIYLTSDWTVPREDLAAMIAEVERTDAALAHGFCERLYWLSWRTLGQALVDAEDEYQVKVSTLLRALLDRCALDSFERIRVPERVRPPAWRYGTRQLEGSE